MKPTKTVKLKISEAFNLRFNKKLVDVETFDGQFKMQFGNRTEEYAQTMYCVEKQDLQSLQGLTIVIQLCRMALSNPEFLNILLDAAKDFMTKSQQPVEVDKEEDEKALRETQALHEGSSLKGDKNDQ